MPTALAQLIAELDTTHWKTPGSTSRRPEGPMARRIEGQAAMNLTVLDRLDEARQVEARVAKLNAEGSPLARREASALHDAAVMRLRLDIKRETEAVRQHACPSCGCNSLLFKGERVFCVNRHCAPAGVQRRWALRDLAFAGPGTPKGISRSEGKPRDLVDKIRAVAFFAPTGKPLSVSTLSRIIRMYDLPTWTRPGMDRAIYVSLSDVMTAHALHMAGREPQACEANPDRPNCSGLADLFFGVRRGQNTDFTEQAKELCGACPLREACLEEAMPMAEQYGIRGGLTATERLSLKRNKTTT